MESGLKNRLHERNPLVDFTGVICKVMKVYIQEDSAILWYKMQGSSVLHIHSETLATSKVEAPFSSMKLHCLRQH